MTPCRDNPDASRARLQAQTIQLEVENAAIALDYDPAQARTALHHVHQTTVLDLRQAGRAVIADMIFGRPLPQRANPDCPSEPPFGPERCRRHGAAHACPYETEVHGNADPRYCPCCPACTDHCSDEA